MICQQIDRTQLFNLLTGVAGIYIIYFIAGLLHQPLIKSQYLNISTGKLQVCAYPFGITLIPNFIAWLMAETYIKFKIENPVKIPHKNAALTGLAATSAAFCSLMAIRYTSYPVVIMMESSSVLPVIFVAVFCTRVTDRNLKLGPKKIIVALLMASGILLFQFTDPSNKKRETQQQAVGILFVIGFFISDGFLPDLQAQIKVKIKPHPVEMMAAVNKWGTIFMLFGLTVSLHIIGFLEFIFHHPLFTVELLIMSIISGFGQFFVYRMIKQFKQHFVPFTITSRKIFTVALSIVIYHHQTNIWQILGILIVLITVTFEFLTQILKPKQQKAQNQKSVQTNPQKYMSQEELRSTQDKKVQQQINEELEDPDKKQNIGNTLLDKQQDAI